MAQTYRTRLTDENLTLAIKTSIENIAKNQSADGSFLSLSGDIDLLRTHTSATIFHTSLVLLCLKDVKDLPEVLPISNSAIDFLVNQKNRNWSWGYWQKGVDKNPPPDHDDTACALSAIAIHRPELITGSILASYVKCLTDSEVRPGGPYSTWIVPQHLCPEWFDIDTVVNANIGYFLSTQNIHLPCLDAYMEKFIENPHITSQYYFSVVATAYFISQAYQGKMGGNILNIVLKAREKNGLWTNDLETALALLVLMHCPADNTGYAHISRLITKGIAHLSAVSASNSCKPYPLYIEEHGDAPMYSGSTALTQAYCLSALMSYKQLYSQKNQDKKTMSHKAKLLRLQDRIMTTCLGCFAASDKTSQQSGADTLTVLMSTDAGNQISLLPYHVRRMLGPGIYIPRKTVMELGVANTLGWLAYRIYDDILDTEDGPGKLDIANIALRNLTVIYHRILGQKYFNIFPSIMDSIDQANAWEYRHCAIARAGQTLTWAALPRYIGYAVLAQKSFGHALGPITLLIKRGCDTDSREMQTVQHFFRHYLIARQLNDDAHDWLADLKQGRVNSASAFVLKEFYRRNKQKTINLTRSQSELQSIFWHHSISMVAHNILAHIRYARTALTATHIFQDTSYLLDLLMPIERSAQKALTEQGMMREFISNY